MLRRLWRLRLLVALGVVVAVLAGLASAYDVKPSKLEVRDKKSSSFGAAQTQFYVDAQRPSLITGQANAQDLIARAHIVATFIGSGDVRRRVASKLGVPESSITVSGPLPDTPGAQNIQPVAQQRANQLLGEGSAASVFVDTDALSPTVTLFVQARTAARAVALADAVPASLKAYLDEQSRANLPAARRRVADQLRTLEVTQKRTASKAERRLRLSEAQAGRTTIRSLGSAVGGTVVETSGKTIGGVVLVAVLGAWCIVLLLLSGVRSRLRRG